MGHRPGHRGLLPAHHLGRGEQCPRRAGQPGASLPGLLLIAMIAGGHWGGEWGSRTIRQLLCREGRRGRVLAAKWLSTWAAGVLTLVACYLVLAAAARSRRTVGRPGLVGVGGRPRRGGARP